MADKVTRIPTPPEATASSSGGSVEGSVAASSPFAPPPKRGLFGPKRQRVPRPRAEVKLRPGNTAEGLSMVYSWAGSVVADMESRGGLQSPARMGSLGRSMTLTAPTAGRLLADFLKRFPVAHNVVATLIGTGTGVRDASAVIGIPILVRRMEAEPRSIPATLPILRAQMRPILVDMLKAAREQKKTEDELARLQAELGEITGVPWSVDRMILVQMLGLPVQVAEEILGGEPVEQVLARHYPTGAQPEPEPEPEPVKAAV